MKGHPFRPICQVASRSDRYDKYLIFEAKMKMRQHVQAWRQQSYFIWNNTQFPFLCFPRISLYTNNVSTTQLAVDTEIFFLRFVEPADTKPVY